MPGDGHHSDLPDLDELSTVEALDILLRVLDRVERKLERLDAVEIALGRLQESIRRPERIVYRPVVAARRLKVGKTMVYKLWNNGQLAYHRDKKGRYSTEAQIQAYLRDAHFVH